MSQVDVKRSSYLYVSDYAGDWSHSSHFFHACVVKLFTNPK